METTYVQGYYVLGCGYDIGQKTHFKKWEYLKHRMKWKNKHTLEVFPIFVKYLHTSIPIKDLTNKKDQMFVEMLVF